MTPDGGQVQYRRILNEVTDPGNYGGSFRVSDALHDVIGHVKGNTTVFFLSDFIDIDEEWSSEMRVATEKFRHVMGVMVRDLRDYELPAAGNIRFEEPGSGRQRVVATGDIADEYEELAAEQEESVADALRGAGASFLKIDTRDEFAGEFAAYFDEVSDQW
ncbi:MAG: hypothetical protein ABEK12_03950, partial [Candidatus Nanohaloarchaea archaeon]